MLDNKNNKSFIKIVGNDQSEDAENIVLSDIIASISYYLNLYHNIGTIDDIDHLGNRRLRLIGELLKNQLRVGLNRTKKNIKDRMSISKFESITPGGLFNFSSLSMAIKTFFVVLVCLILWIKLILWRLLLKSVEFLHWVAEVSIVIEQV
ncbi:MAG: hypothetical protein Q8879_00785 [Candidatus Phytoplasma australasiaticum]|nr:hypothetical protein [Candidatus Phytoplasma australasiaticum]